MRTLNSLTTLLVSSVLMLSISKMSLAEDSLPGAVDSTVETGDYFFSLDTAVPHDNELDFDTVEGEQALHEEPLGLHTRKRYRLPNLMNNEHLRISFKGNITLHLLNKQWRRSLGMENSALTFRIQDGGEQARLIFKERF